MIQWFYYSSSHPESPFLPMCKSSPSTPPNPALLPTVHFPASQQNNDPTACLCFALHSQHCSPISHLNFLLSHFLTISPATEQPTLLPFLVSVFRKRQHVRLIGKSLHKWNRLAWKEHVHKANLKKKWINMNMNELSIWIYKTYKNMKYVLFKRHKYKLIVNTCLQNTYESKSRGPCRPVFNNLIRE